MKVSFVYSNRAEYSILEPYIKYFKNKEKINIIDLSKKIKNIHEDKNLDRVYKVCYEEFKKNKIDYACILGDRRELPFIALAALYLDIKLVHIGAGEYLEGLPTYDQIIRPVISILSKHQICLSKNALNEVKKLFSGISNLHADAKNFGNPVFSELDLKKLKRPIKEKYDLVLLHPQSLSEEDTKKDIEQLKKFISKKKIIFIKGNKDKNYEIIEKFYATLNKDKKYKIYKTLPKEKYFSFVKHCDKFYTNTSSISEIIFLNKNCLVSIGNRNKKRVGHELNKKAPELLYKYLKK
jgi:UDP-N-acetylglucosamine 2-epimerase